MGPAMKSLNDGLMAGLLSSGINLAKNGFVPGTQTSEFAMAKATLRASLSRFKLTVRSFWACCMLPPCRCRGMPRSDQGEGAPSLVTWWPPRCLVAEARPRNWRCACETRPETQESEFVDWTMGGIDVIKCHDAMLQTGIPFHRCFINSNVIEVVSCRMPLNLRLVPSSYSVSFQLQDVRKQHVSNNLIPVFRCRWTSPTAGNSS